jgi:hypothetical protein
MNFFIRKKRKIRIIYLPSLLNTTVSDPITNKAIFAALLTLITSLATILPIVGNQSNTRGPNSSQSFSNNRRRFSSQSFSNNRRRFPKCQYCDQLGHLLKRIPRCKSLYFKMLLQPHLF